MANFSASPSTRRLALQRGVDLSALADQLGRRNFSRDDILQAGQVGSAGHAGSSPPASVQSSFWDVDHNAHGSTQTKPLSRFALIAAENLSASNSMIPAVTHHDSADMSRIEALRADYREVGQRITALAFHVAVLCQCLAEYPTFNASLSADGRDLILKDFFHVGIAVDTPFGLMVPVIRNADQLRISEISAAITDLSTRARKRKIKPHELGGASMSISSLGGLGGEAFTPIVNPPEVAIIGLTRMEMRPVWDGAEFVPRPMVPVDLSYDHRVINGADAARFVTRYKTLIANPDELLLIAPNLRFT